MFVSNSFQMKLQMLDSLESDDAETLVRLLKRVGESLNIKSVPVGESITTYDQKDEP